MAVGKQELQDIDLGLNPGSITTSFVTLTI